MSMLTLIKGKDDKIPPKLISNASSLQQNNKGKHPGRFHTSAAGSSEILVPVENGLIRAVKIAAETLPSLEFESVVQLCEVHSGLGLKISGKTGGPVLSIVDTGAMESLLPAAVLHRFKKIKTLPPLVLKSVSQNNINTVTRSVIELYVPGFGQIRHAVSFIDNLTHGLIGLPLLKVLEASVIQYKKRFYLGFNKIKSSTLNKLTLQKDIILEPNSKIAKRVEASLEHFEHVKPGVNFIYIEGTTFVPPCIADLTHDSTSLKNSIDCYFLNPTEHTVTINEGTKLNIELWPSYRKQGNFDPTNLQL